MKSFTAALIISNVMAFEAEKYSTLADKQLNDDSYTSIDITVDGETKTLYIASGNAITPGQSSAHIPSNGRGYLIETPYLGGNDPQYFRPNLKNASVEWDVDLSNHGCGCIAAFYLVSMPGVDSSGNTWMDTDGFGYCDAN